jgi:hypothetical protein
MTAAAEVQTNPQSVDVSTADIGLSNVYAIYETASPADDYRALPI